MVAWRTFCVSCACHAGCRGNGRRASAVAPIGGERARHEHALRRSAHDSVRDPHSTHCRGCFGGEWTLRFRSAVSGSLSQSPGRSLRYRFVRWSVAWRIDRSVSVTHGLHCRIRNYSIAGLCRCNRLHRAGVLAGKRERENARGLVVIGRIRGEHHVELLVVLSGDTRSGLRAGHACSVFVAAWDNWATNMAAVGNCFSNARNRACGLRAAGAKAQHPRAGRGVCNASWHFSAADTHSGNPDRFDSDRCCRGFGRPHQLHGPDYPSYSAHDSWAGPCATSAGDSVGWCIISAVGGHRGAHNHCPCRVACGRTNRVYRRTVFSFSFKEGKKGGTVLMPLLEFAHINFGYGSGELFHDLNGRIFANDCIALVGRNGVGKTTLLRLAAGTLAPQSGEVRLKQSVLRSMKQREIAKLVAFVPQNVALPFSFTAEQFVEQGRTPFLKMFGGLGVADRKAIERAMGLTDRSEEH